MLRVRGEGNKDEKTTYPPVRAILVYARYLITAVHFLENFFIHFLSSHNISHVCKTAARGSRDEEEVDGHGGRAGSHAGREEFLLKNRRARVGVESARGPG